MPRPFALMIGISEFQEKAFSQVPYAAEDLQELQTLLEKTGFDKQNIYSFFNLSATKTRIESILRKILSLIQSDDALFFFYFGHGFHSEGENYLATSDSLPNDLPMTSLALADIWNGLETRGIAQRWFLDAIPAISTEEKKKEPSLPVSRGFDVDIMRSYFASSTQSLCFLASEPQCVSHSSSSLKHRIFGYHLLESFGGQSLDALVDNQLTSTSLRDYLLTEMPRTLRKVFSEAMEQKIQAMGCIESEVVLATFPVQTTAKPQTETIDPKQIQRMIFRADTVAKAKSLAGFQKGHQIPEYSLQAAQKFIARITAEEIKQDIESVFNKLRKAFQIKRKDLEASFDREAMGFIRTPFFDYTIQILVDPTDFQQIIWRKEISGVQSMETIMKPEFQTVFGTIFDTFYLEFQVPFSVEQFVDRFDENPIPDIDIQTNIDASSCDIRLQGVLGKIHLESHQLIIQNRPSSAQALIEQFLMFEKRVRQHQSFLAIDD